MNYSIEFTRNALKDYELVKKSPYSKKVKKLLFILESDPFKPPLEALTGNMQGLYSRRITKEHRLVYEVNKEKQTIKIRSMWTHYENV